MRITYLLDLLCDIWTSIHQKDYRRAKRLVHQVYDILEAEKEKQ